MKHSESIKEITAALAKAQAVIRNAAMDKTNPAFKSKYADLSSVWAACRNALSTNGIAVFQSPSADGAKVTVTTLLAHSTGEWVEGELTVTADKGTPQGIGSAITYARRYGLSALVGVAPGDDIADDGDDDGEAAEGRTHTPPTTRVEAVKAKVAEKVNGNGKQDPISAFKFSALQEATLLLGDDDHAKRWFREVREDPQGARPWTDKDVEKVKAALALLRADLNTQSGRAN